MSRVSAARPRTGEAGRLDPRAIERLLEEYEGSEVTLCTRTRIRDDVVGAVRDWVCEKAGRDLELVVRVAPTMDAGAVLLVGDSGRVVLDPRIMWLSSVESELRDRIERGEVTDEDDAFQCLMERLTTRGVEPSVEELAEAGQVVKVGDGVALCTGLRDVGSQEVVRFAGGVEGIALSLHQDRVGVVLLGDERLVREGASVRRTGQRLMVPAGEGLLGRVIDPLGTPLDERGAIVASAWVPLERPAPAVVDRAPVSTPLHTGIKVIDSLVPLGRGQRELVIGDRGLGKTTIALDVVLAQRGRGVACIYCAIGQKASTVREIVATLEKYGALDHTTVVVSLPADPPSIRYIAPYAACAMGEHFMDHGGDALVVFDDLTKHAVTYREISALLERPVGREAYPGDIFYLHARLLERAAHLAPSRGGGSLTALPIVETLAGDISAFIPTNVISICDGQIVLSAAAFNEGRRPAMDSGLSVSRVGGAAQEAAMKRVAGRLRIDLAQYEEMARFVKFGAEVDEATRAQLRRGERARELLRQAAHDPMTLAGEVTVLYAAVSGALDVLELDQIAAAEHALREWVGGDGAPLIEAFIASGGADEDAERTLRAGIDAQLAQFSDGSAREDDPASGATAEESGGTGSSARE